MSLLAHGVSLDFTQSALVVTASTLRHSLGAAEQQQISWDDIQDVASTEPGPARFGAVTIAYADGEAPAQLHIRVVPGTSAATIAERILATRAGELPADAPVAAPSQDVLASPDAAGAPASLVGLDFTAVDVETANDNWGSICAIGAVRFRDGKEVASRTWLCTPPPGLEHFAPINMSIHGITPDDVADAPAFAAVFAELQEFLGDDVLVAHNAQFDATALQLASAAAGVKPGTVRLACSLALARNASKAGVIAVDNHRLPTVAGAIGAPKFSHHDATEDACAAGLIVTALAQRFGLGGAVDAVFAARGFALGTLGAAGVMPVLSSHTAPTSAADIGAGTDFRDKTRWSTAPASLADASPAAPGTPGAGSASAGVPEAAAAAANGASASQRRPAPWKKFETPAEIPAPNLDADPSNPLFEQNVTLTGDFGAFDKGTLWSHIAHRGATVGKSVTKKTTILVVGTWATVTTKEKRADELIAKGQDIQKWDEARLLRELGLDEQPPF